MACMRHRYLPYMILVSAALVILFAGSVVAQEGQADEWVPEPSEARDADTTEKQVVGENVQPVSVLGVLGKLALVAGLIYAASWGLKMYQERDIGGSRAGAGGLIHIRESVSLGTSGRLHAVKFADRTLLLVSIGERVEVLAEDGQEPSTESEMDPLAALADNNGNGNGNGKKSRGNGKGSGLRESESPQAWAKKRDMLIKSLQESGTGGT